MTDEPTAQPDQPAQQPDAREVQRQNLQDAQRNLAERLFPGPSRRMSKQYAQHIEGLLQNTGANGQGIGRDNRGAQGTTIERGQRPPRGAGQNQPAAEQVNLATTEDIAKLQETLDAQTELLRALLSNSVDAQTDARSTAQNSRTFAWAGTAIALLTLIATVISIVAVVQAK